MRGHRSRSGVSSTAAVVFSSGLLTRSSVLYMFATLCPGPDISQGVVLVVSEAARESLHEHFVVFG
ncbi:hypothetical protein DFR69_106227 [Nocardia neocaledoniensis]|uniref:Uncharacterized protein n=1 Tax=Nocardia neocaledoniensis TaxID=236511 RepID=A0A317NGA0_9NOCA|nr:hypothetical protein DFR69_106227 [Nocardia neocaledoniensis]